MKPRTQKRKYNLGRGQEATHSLYRMEIGLKEEQPVEQKQQTLDKLENSIKKYVENLLFPEEINCLPQK